MREGELSELSELEQCLLATISAQARGTTTIPVYPAHLALQPEWQAIRIGPLVRRLLTLGYLQQAPNRTLTITPAGIRRIAQDANDRPLP